MAASIASSDNRGKDNDNDIDVKNNEPEATALPLQHNQSNVWEIYFESQNGLNRS